MNFKPRLVLWPALLLAGAGFVLRPLERSAGRPAALPAGQLVALVGQGGLTAALGGLRSVVAGGFWLRAHRAWESRDEAAMGRLLALAVAADERPVFFWLNGARMLAYDVPAWLPPDLPGPVRENATRAAAGRALAWLELGMRRHGAEAGFYVEMANIHLRQLGDAEAAARCYRLAAGQPGAPYYAARVHAELLRGLGRPQEALDWLRQVLPGLPADDPAAQRAVVVARIEALEREVAGR